MSEKIFLVDSGTNISKLEQKIQEFPQNTIYALSYEIHKVLEKKEYQKWDVWEDVWETANQKV